MTTTPSTTVRSRSPLRRGAVALASTGALLLAGVTGALASHTFTDVPDAHPFHDDIDWLADTGITSGFADGTFRPGEAVTRGQMAAFEHRGAHGLTFLDDALSASSVVPAADWQLVDTLGSVEKLAGGTALRVSLATMVRAVDAGALGYCNWQLRVGGVNTVGGVGNGPGDTVLVATAPGGGVEIGAAHMEAWFLDVPAGVHDVTLHVRGTADSCLSDVGGWDDRTTVEELVVRD